ncbi:hypothetical protein AWZ03_015315, partial [Drosophila navojoa]
GSSTRSNSRKKRGRVPKIVLRNVADAAAISPPTDSPPRKYRARDESSADESDVCRCCRRLRRHHYQRCHCSCAATAPAAATPSLAAVLAAAAAAALTAAAPAAATTAAPAARDPASLKMPSTSAAAAAANARSINAAPAGAGAVSSNSMVQRMLAIERGLRRAVVADNVPGAVALSVLDNAAEFQKLILEMYGRMKELETLVRTRPQAAAPQTSAPPDASYAAVTATAAAAPRARKIRENVVGDCDVQQS